MPRKESTRVPLAAELHGAHDGGGDVGGGFDARSPAFRCRGAIESCGGVDGFGARVYIRTERNGCRSRSHQVLSVLFCSGVALRSSVLCLNLLFFSS